ncbi:expressed unknown protein [Seminavis robusta]|uniref:F-box domain-containing protein n=1 Tax=Seminavis robusta TaxID=568900 RepID=A0A9N8H4D3_9STRA|nr:expressed unknown protein [Seminavis robusta]|eukprot:Sro59_g034300.1 n/a (109) ;mRNA; f:114701-115027
MNKDDGEERPLKKPKKSPEDKGTANSSTKADTCTKKPQSSKLLNLSICETKNFGQQEVFSNQDIVVRIFSFLDIESILLKARHVNSTWFQSSSRAVLRRLIHDQTKFC